MAKHDADLSMMYVVGPLIDAWKQAEELLAGAPVEVFLLKGIRRGWATVQMWTRLIGDNRSRKW